MFPYKETISRNVQGTSRYSLEIPRKKWGSSKRTRSHLKFTVQIDSGLGRGQWEMTLVGTPLSQGGFRSHHHSNLTPIHFCHVGSSGQFVFGLQPETPLIRSYRETFIEGSLCFSDDPEVPRPGLSLSWEFSIFQEKWGTGILLSHFFWSWQYDFSAFPRSSSLDELLPLMWYRLENICWAPIWHPVLRQRVITGGDKNP